MAEYHVGVGLFSTGDGTAGKTGACPRPPLHSPLSPTPTGLCLAHHLTDMLVPRRWAAFHWAGMRAPRTFPRASPGARRGARRGGPTRRARVCSLGPWLQRPISSFEAARRRQQDDEREREDSALGLPTVHVSALPLLSFFSMNEKLTTWEFLKEKYSLNSLL